jgi:hypothetical protein
MPFYQDKMMFGPAERLIAFAMLHQGYSSQLANPFVPLLINVSCEVYTLCFSFLENKAINLH